MEGDAGDRRRFLRLPLSASVQYMLNGTQDSGTARTSDVSAGGVSIMFVSKCDAGARLKLIIKLADGSKSIEVTGRIAWTQPITVYGVTTYDTGIEFLDLAEEDRARVIGDTSR